MAGNVLIIGNGGREHAIGLALNDSDEVRNLYFTDTNAGIEELLKFSKNPNDFKVKADDVVGIGDLALAANCRLVIVGPEAPLIKGAGDYLRLRGHKVFGPDKMDAQLEGSKAFATGFMRKYDINHPPNYVTYDLPQARMMIQAKGGPEAIVIKADAPAGGKGVVLPEDMAEAEMMIQAMFSGEGFDGAGKDIVNIQERYHGPELSVFAVTDGDKFIILPFTQDHKRLRDNDEGPNTGGMGAYTPLPTGMLSTDQIDKITDITERTINGMDSEGTPYYGVLYIGLMLAEELGGDPAVIEYNARFGDPETQVLMPALAKAGIDIYELLSSAAEGHLSDIKIPSNIGHVVLTACLAAHGYPENPRKGDIINGLDKTYKDVIIHHGGTKKLNGQVLTNGGRVLYVTGQGKTADKAANVVDAAIAKIEGDPNRIGFVGQQYRHDIGYQAR